MRTLGLRKFMFLAVAAVMAVGLSACLGNGGEDAGLGTPDDALSTGLCSTPAWELDSVGSRLAEDAEFESYTFSSSGRGRHVGIDKTTNAKVSTDFTWLSYNSYILAIYYSGYDAPAYVYYGLGKDGLLRFAGYDTTGAATYYTFKKTNGAQ